MPDAESQPLRFVRTLDAPPSEVYDALTDPDRLARWAWGSLTRNARAECDVRVGGRYRVTTETEGGATWAFAGEYLQVEPGRSLVCSLEWEQPMGYEAVPERMTFRLADREGGTELTFTHEGVADPEARDVHRQGWINVLETLERELG